jgi:hypothetical protein
MASAHGFPCDRAPAGGGRVARIDPRNAWRNPSDARVGTGIQSARGQALIPLRGASVLGRHFSMYRSRFWRRRPTRPNGNHAYEDQLTAYTLTSSIVYKVTLTSIDMMKFQ